MLIVVGVLGGSLGVPRVLGGKLGGSLVGLLSEPKDTMSLSSLNMSLVSIMLPCFSFTD